MLIDEAIDLVLHEQKPLLRSESVLGMSVTRRAGSLAGTELAVRTAHFPGPLDRHLPWLLDKYVRTQFGLSRSRSYQLLAEIRRSKGMEDNCPDGSVDFGLDRAALSSLARRGAGGEVVASILQRDVAHRSGLHAALRWRTEFPHERDQRRREPAAPRRNADESCGAAPGRP